MSESRMTPPGKPPTDDDLLREVELARSELARTTGALMGKADSGIQRAGAALDRTRQTARSATQFTRSIRDKASHYRLTLAGTAAGTILVLALYRVARHQVRRSTRGRRRR